VVGGAASNVNHDGSSPVGLACQRDESGHPKHSQYLLVFLFIELVLAVLWRSSPCVGCAVMPLLRSEVFRVQFWMGLHGACSPKLTRVWSNDKCIVDLTINAMFLSRDQRKALTTVNTV